MAQKVDNILAKNVWEEIGDWWDAQMVEGDLFHRYLIHPYVLSQLEIAKTDNVVDLACGNGALTRQIAKKANKVVGVDFSNSLLKNARLRSEAERIAVEYATIDLTNSQELAKINEKGPFNKAVCSMALQDMETIEPLIQAVHNLLPKNGCFVVSIPHPCFNSGMIKFIMPNNKAVESSNDYGILRNSYIRPVSFAVHAKSDQPQPHPHFHRPLNIFLENFFDNGFVLNACEEPIFDPSVLQKKDGDFLWSLFPEIPAAMILKFINNIGEN